MSRTEQDSARARTAADVARIEDVIDRVERSGRTHWLARVAPLATEELSAQVGLRCYAHAGTRDRFYWERTELGDFFVAWGTVDEFEGAGPDRFSNVRDWSQDVAGRLEWIGAARPASAASFLGGFAFEDEGSAATDWKAFPAARFLLPEILVELCAGESRSVLFVRVETGAQLDSVLAELTSRERDLAAALAAPPTRSKPGSATPASLDFEDGFPAGPEYRVRSDRGHAVFEAQIGSALEAIRSGRFAKLVLARSLRVDHDGELEVPAFLGRLRTLYPSCTLVAVGRGRDTFLAATPETLVRVRGRHVETAALAGSAPRGRQPEEDRAFAERLWASPKERAEHEHVVAAIRQVLESRCDELEVLEEPVLRKLFGIQHLETGFRGRLRSEPTATAPDLLELVSALHPTPAVAGAPAREARDWLRRHEGLDRGWYASPVGWLDVAGGGDLCVALRSALIRNGLGEPGISGASRALLFAGAGIVEGSLPEQELAETRIKLRALLAPLTEI